MFEKVLGNLNGLFIQIEALLGKMEYQNFDFRYAVYALVFLGVLMAYEGLRQLLIRGETVSETRNRRMRLISSGKTEKEILDLFKAKEKKGLLSNLPVVGDLHGALRAAGITTPAEVFAVGCASGFVICAAAMSQITNPLLAFGLSISLFLVLPLLLVANARRKRVDRTIAQLPDALDLMARGLKVGHPLNATLQSVAAEMPDPIGTEIGIVVDQIAYGDDLTDAMRDFAQRFPVEDIQYLAVAIGIQHGTGGDLARILSTLARVIRGRMTMRRRIRAISSEGRLSAILLSSLPVFIGVFTSITSPSYYGDVSDDPLFIPVALIVVALVVLNALTLRKLVNFRI
ncbi:MAG: type II secretion system F family protein [Pseudomonadota bacterium]